MASIPTALTLQPLRSPFLYHKVLKRRQIWVSFHHLNSNYDKLRRDFVIRAGNNINNTNSHDYEKSESEATRDIFKLENKNCLKETMCIASPAITLVRRNLCSKLAIFMYITITALVLIIRQIMIKRHNNNKVNQGSVSDLVRRGQLKSNRRGIIEKSGLYNDPFDNPFVKTKEDKSTIEMFGKIYKLAPTKLTKEKQLTHQERRSRAYQWKKPEVFLKEGETVPDDVDPGSVRFIPVNHPFAEIKSEISEEMIKSNVFQRDGVPFRVRAEHEALQKKLEAEPKIKELGVNFKDIKGVDKPPKSLKDVKLGESNKEKQDDQENHDY